MHVHTQHIHTQSHNLRYVTPCGWTVPGQHIWSNTAPDDWGVLSDCILCGETLVRGWGMGGGWWRRRITAAEWSVWVCMGALFCIVLSVHLALWYMRRNSYRLSSRATGPVFACVPRGASGTWRTWGTRRTSGSCLALVTLMKNKTKHKKLVIEKTKEEDYYQL